MKTETLKLDQIIPYWRNPRKISGEAVNALVESINQYGYQQPIVVDSHNVILIGHTRYAALRKIGWEEAEVIVADLPPIKAKELRILDNRTQELNYWDFDKLFDELSALDSQLLQSYFPEIDIPGQARPISFEVEDEPELEPTSTVVEFVCPSCFHSWDHDVQRAEVMSGRIRVK